MSYSFSQQTVAHNHNVHQSVVNNNNNQQKHKNFKVLKFQYKNHYRRSSPLQLARNYLKTYNDNEFQVFLCLITARLDIAMHLLYELKTIKSHTTKENRSSNSRILRNLFKEKTKNNTNNQRKIMFNNPIKFVKSPSQIVSLLKEWEKGRLQKENDLKDVGDIDIHKLLSFTSINPKQWSNNNLVIYALIQQWDQCNVDWGEILYQYNVSGVHLNSFCWSKEKLFDTIQDPDCDEMTLHPFLPPLPIENDENTDRFQIVPPQSNPQNEIDIDSLTVLNNLMETLIDHTIKDIKDLNIKIGPTLNTDNNNNILNDENVLKEIKINNNNSIKKKEKTLSL